VKELCVTLRDKVVCVCETRGGEEKEEEEEEEKEKQTGVHNRKTTPQILHRPTILEKSRFRRSETAILWLKNTLHIFIPHNSVWSSCF